MHIQPNDSGADKANHVYEVPSIKNANLFIKCE